MVIGLTDNLYSLAVYMFCSTLVKPDFFCNSIIRCKTTFYTTCKPLIYNNLPAQPQNHPDNPN